MKAIVLLATLKKKGLSNTETLAEFLTGYLKKSDIDCTTIKLVDYNILPGTYSDMGQYDDWPQILRQILDADIIIFATPIWWNNQSSEMQRVIERLDEIHDEILQGKKSKLEGKVGGIVITGDSDGAQHVISNIANFFNAVGVVLPPYATLSTLLDMQKKSAENSKKELLEKYEKEYADTAKKMVRQLKKFADNS